MKIVLSTGIFAILSSLVALILFGAVALAIWDWVTCDPGEDILCLGEPAVGSETFFVIVGVVAGLFVLGVVAGIAAWFAWLALYGRIQDLNKR